MRTRFDTVFGIGFFLILGLGISLIIVMSVKIAAIHPVECDRSNCTVTSKSCNWKSISYPCYSANGNYTYIARNREYTYSVQLVSDDAIEVAAEACREFLKSPTEACYFKADDKIITTSEDVYFGPVVVFIIAIVIIAGGICGVIGGIRLRKRILGYRAELV